MEMFFRFFVKRIGSLRFLYNYSSWQWIRRIRAKFGPVAIASAAEVKLEPNTPALGYCPHCAGIILPGQMVSLFKRKRTTDDPKVKISDKQTLWVEVDGIKFQIGCLPLSCGNQTPPNRLEEGDLIGRLNNAGALGGVSVGKKGMIAPTEIPCFYESVQEQDQDAA